MFKLMASHISLKSSLEAYDKVGVRISKNIRIHQALAGGPENLGCFLDHYRNYIHKARRLRMDQGDAECLRKFFVEMQLKDKDLFYDFDLDGLGRLNNILWIHLQSIMAYQEFMTLVALILRIILIDMEYYLIYSLVSITTMNLLFLVVQLFHMKQQRHSVVFSPHL